MEKKGLPIRKSRAILLTMQMVLTLLLLAVASYLLVFASINHLGGWMIASYVCIIISVLSILCYGLFGYKKGEVAYLVCLAPFLLAIFVNILLPGRDATQIGLLCLLFALTFAFLLRQKDVRFTKIISYIMVGVALSFSIYSSITANTQFLGEISSSWVTYFSMYASIFIPSVMAGTFALTYEVNEEREGLR